jgi:hypothetical protein
MIAQIAAGENVYVFDVLELSKLGQVARLSSILEVVLCNGAFTKVMHDMAMAVHALQKVRKGRTPTVK